MSTPGRLFLAAVIAQSRVEDYMNLGRVRHLFKNTEPAIYEFFEKHLQEHGKFPSPSTIEKVFAEKLPEALEPPSFYHAQMVDRHLELSMRRAVEEAGEFLVNEDKKEPRKAYEHLLHSMMELELERTGDTIHDFRNVHDVVWSAYKAKALGTKVGVPFGWPYMDHVSAGMMPGDVVSIIGRPQAGKTWLMLRMADHVHRMGFRVLFVSMEMDLLTVEQRQLALRSKIAVARIRQQAGQALTDQNRKKLLEVMADLKSEETPYVFVDGQKRAPTVVEIAALARHVRPDVVFVDAAYLLRHADRRLGRYDRVAENTDELKGRIASALHIPLVCSWQFSREASKKMRKGQEIGLEDIGYSDAIGQISTIVLGMLDEETPETIIRKRVELLKGRGGEKGEFSIKFDLDRMDLAEHVDVDLKDLKVT